MTSRILIVFLVCVLSIHNGLAQAQDASTRADDPTLPAGIEGKRFQLLIKALTTEDEELGKRFYDEHISEEFKANFPIETYYRGFHWIAKVTGGLDFHGIRTYEPSRDDQAVAICRDRIFGSWWAIVFKYGEGPEEPITAMRVTRASLPADIATAKISEERFAQELGALLESICERDLFSGTVLVAKNDDLIFRHACGEASKRFHAPVNMDTKFNIGSMNKMFTATAVAQLVERDLLSYDDPISKHVDESWLPEEITERVTVHHLLSHTSGLGDFFNETFEQGSRTRFRTVDDYKTLVAGDTLAFDPGTDWQYSNTGMLLAGVVIESVTGGDYYDYIRENIYGPAGLKNTDSYDMDCPVENLAIGYWRSGKCGSGWKNNYYEHLIRGCPAGGGFSTAPDLWMFARALQTGVLVSQESLDLMWKDYRGEGGGYGYGFMLRETPKGNVVGHDGGFTGIEAYFDMYLNSGHIVVVMTNTEEAAWPLERRIRELLARVE